MENNNNYYVVNEESINELYESLFLLGVDSLDDYFKLVEKSVYSKNNNLKRRKKTINIKPLIDKIKSHKITKTDIKVLSLTILFCIGMISTYKITKDINNLKGRNEITDKLIEKEKDYLLQQGIVVESYTGEKGSVRLIDNPNYNKITTTDITLNEAFNFMLFIQSNYDNLYIQKKLLNNFIEVQTYNNGTMYYLDWNDFLKQNNFNNNKEFIDYCYQNIEKNKKIVKKL